MAIFWESMNSPCIEGRVLDWQRYEVLFRREAEDQHLSPAHIARCLDYARVLTGRGLPIIYDDLHLVGLVGYSLNYLRAAAHSPKDFYRNFDIAKKAGGVRTISVPLPNLMNIQRWILKNILDNCKPTDYAKAFWKGKSIRENARFHRKQHQVLSLDIENFFSSINIKRITHFFKRLGYHPSVAGFLARLCCLGNVLPQGAPSRREIRKASYYIEKYGIYSHLDMVSLLVFFCH
jgi:RNA-directed DNA polymerase